MNFDETRWMATAVEIISIGAAVLFALLRVL
jgi:hypothetical protein